MLSILVAPDASKPWMTQSLVRRPFEELNARNQKRFQPVARQQSSQLSCLRPSGPQPLRERLAKQGAEYGKFSLARKQAASENLISMKFNHIGIPTKERFAGEIPLPHLKMTVSDHKNNAFG